MLCCCVAAQVHANRWNSHTPGSQGSNGRWMGQAGVRATAEGDAQGKVALIITYVFSQCIPPAVFAYANTAGGMYLIESAMK